MSFNPVSLVKPEDCSICWEPIKEGSCHQAGNVIHIFHEACLNEAVVKGTVDCPLCREKITSINDKPVSKEPIEQSGSPTIQFCIDVLGYGLPWTLVIVSMLYAGKLPIFNP
jgi:hypothetical protein